MLYYYLAESLFELDELTHFTEKLETGTPLMELTNGSSLGDEIRRIAARAAQDIYLFKKHLKTYFYLNLKTLNSLIIRVLEVIVKLPEMCFMTEHELFIYEYSLLFKDGLKELADFFIQLCWTHSECNSGLYNS